MSFNATIAAEGDENLMKLFKAEQQDFKNKRSSYTIKEQAGKIIFEISADDATALRSTLDSVAKGLKIYEDMKKIK